MAKSANKERVGKAKKVTPYHQSCLDQLVLAKAENDTSKIKMLSKIIKKLDGLS